MALLVSDGLSSGGMGIRTPESVRTTALKAVALGHFAIPPQITFLSAAYKSCRSLAVQFRSTLVRRHAQVQFGQTLRGVGGVVPLGSGPCRSL